MTLACSGPAAAQWTAGAYVGWTSTAANALTLSRPDSGALVVDPVHYDARAFDAPIYYGYRVGRFFGDRFGVEGELIHLKVYARPPLGQGIESFAISHGLNLVLVNVMLRQRLGGPSSRAWLMVRGGVGPTVPHAESRVDGVAQAQYELGSAGFQGAAGVELRLTGSLFGTAEYKLTTAAPGVSVHGGTIHGRYTSQHVAVGLAWRQR